MNNKLEDPTFIFEEYKKTGDENLRNRLVMHYSYIAQVVAKQMSGLYANYAQLEDIVNEGIITIIDCIEKYDYNKNVKFESYAFLRVKGAVIDFIRRQDWLPRRVRRLSKDISLAVTSLSAKLCREPTQDEIAEYLNISQDILNKYYMEITNSVLLSFEGMLQSIADNGGVEPALSESGIPDRELFDDEFKKTLICAIDTLSDRERMVVSLYFYNGLKLNEIANILGVSESRVSQINSKAVIKLKSKIENYI